ncbi:MAG: hypothetical protein U0746_13015 [Gemmataceae bacterium]
MLNAVRTHRWLIPIAYPLFGLAFGLADPWLGRIAMSIGTKPGVATAVVVNGLLPMVALTLGFGSARVSTACLGAIAMTLGLIAGLAACYAPIDNPTPRVVLASVPPLLVIAALGYAILGSVAAGISQTRSVARVTPH